MPQVAHAQNCCDTNKIETQSYSVLSESKAICCRQ